LKGGRGKLAERVIPELDFDLNRPLIKVVFVLVHAHLACAIDLFHIVLKGPADAVHEAIQLGFPSAPQLADPTVDGFQVLFDVCEFDL
jgi:hypothetical protein